MPDTPDYSKYGLQSVRFSLQDMGELAVRMGSADWFQRLGNVVYMDDMGTGLSHFVTSTAGAGSAISVITSAESGSGYAIKFSTAAILGASCSLTRYLPVMPVNKHGLEGAFSVGGTGNYIQFQYIARYLTITYQAILRFDLANNQIQVYNASAVYEVVEPVFKWWQDLRVFNHFKITLDLPKQKYGKLLYNNTEYDLSSIGLRMGGANTQPAVQLLNEMAGEASGVRTAAVGLLILTTDEP